MLNAQNHVVARLVFVVSCQWISPSVVARMLHRCRVFSSTAEASSCSISFCDSHVGWRDAGSYPRRLSASHPSSEKNIFYNYSESGQIPSNSRIEGASFTANWGRRPLNFTRSCAGPSSSKSNSTISSTVFDSFK